MTSFAGKTILVTGATGFIGRHLVSRLREDKGTHLILLTRQQKHTGGEDAVWINTSLDQLSQDIWRKIGINRIDIVFHLGAFIPKAVSDADHIENVYRDNLLGTRALLESFPAPPERIVFASTIDVYGLLAHGAPIDELSPTQPDGLYGSSKLFCEQLIRVYANHCGCSYAILRYGHIFGPGEECYMKLIPQMIRRLLLGEEPTLYGDGSMERDFLYVTDAVEATMRAALSDAVALGPVNVVRGMSVPIREVVEMLVGITGFAGGIRFLENRQKSFSLRFDNQLMRSILGEWPLVSLKEGLSHEVNYFRSLNG